MSWHISQNTTIRNAFGLLLRVLCRLTGDPKRAAAQDEAFETKLNEILSGYEKTTALLSPNLKTLLIRL